MLPSFLNIIADENIPLVKEAFALHGKVTLLSGRDITQQAVKNADALLVRSVTPINEALLKNSKVCFVATATAGFDHVDTAYLQARNIGFASAPASNAESVVEYVIASLLHVAVQKNEPLRGKTVGIVGYGNIGSRLAPRLHALGMNVLVNDPFSMDNGQWTMDNDSLDGLLAISDIVTFHVPLTKSGKYPTYHLLNAENMSLLKENVWLINASRGGVIDETALWKHRSKIGALILDVWEREPLVSPQMGVLADIATPHIAGYSYDGKLLGTQMIYEAFCNFFGFGENSFLDFFNVSNSLQVLKTPQTSDEKNFLHALVEQMYDLAADDARFRPILNMNEVEQSAFFHQLRKDYPKRYAFQRFSLPKMDVPTEWQEAVSQGLKTVMNDE